MHAGDGFIVAVSICRRVNTASWIRAETHGSASFVRCLPSQTTSSTCLLPRTFSRTAFVVPDVLLPYKSAGINKRATFWYNNCRSVKNKIVDLQALAGSLPAGFIILLSETWLGCSIADSKLLPLDA